MFEGLSATSHCSQEIAQHEKKFQSRCVFGLLIFYRFVFSVFHRLAFGALAAKRGFDEIAKLSIG